MINAKALFGSILIKVNTTNKEKYNLTKDIQIKIERGYDFNQRIDRPALVEVIDGGGIPAGSMGLVNYLSFEKTYEVNSNGLLTKEELKEGYKIYSIPEDMCFAYFHNDEWLPCKDLYLTLRVYKPYKGMMIGIEPEVLKDRLYCLKGQYAGKVMIVTLHSDYEIIWHNDENREERLIRTMDREIMAIDDGMTKDLKKGKYLIGYSVNDCKVLN